MIYFEGFFLLNSAGLIVCCYENAPFFPSLLKGGAENENDRVTYLSSIQV